MWSQSRNLRFVWCLFFFGSLWLGLNRYSLSITYAEDSFFNSFTYTPPSPVNVGDTLSYTLDGFYGGGAGGGTDCLGFWIPTNWATNGLTPFVKASSSGLIPTGPMTAGSCPSMPAAPTNSGGSTAFFVNVGVAGPVFADTTSINIGPFVSGNIGTNWNVRATARYGNLGGVTQIDALPLTINPVSTTRYVANTVAECLGLAPCDTGTSGLLNALANASATEIVVVGNYNASAALSYGLSGGDFLHGNTPTAVINLIGSCNGTDFLTVSGGSIIQDLTIDGTCSSGTAPASGINVTSSTSTSINNVTIRDFAKIGLRYTAGNATHVLTNSTFIIPTNGVGVDKGGTGTLQNSGTTYTGLTTTNNTGLRVNSGLANVNGNTFTKLNLGLRINGGSANVGTTASNTFGGASGSGNNIGIWMPGGTAVIQFNTFSFQKGQAAVVFTGSAVSANIWDNQISNGTTSGTAGVQISGGSTVSVKRNHIVNNLGFGVNVVPSFGGTAVIEDNNINGNNGAASNSGAQEQVNNTSAGTVTVLHNYWGTGASPSVTIPDLSGDFVRRLGGSLIIAGAGSPGTSVKESSGTFTYKGMTVNAGANTISVADFGTSVAPYGIGLGGSQNNQCSRYYGVYFDSGSSSFTLSIDYFGPGISPTCLTGVEAAPSIPLWYLALDAAGNPIGTGWTQETANSTLDTVNDRVNLTVTGPTLALASATSLNLVVGNPNSPTAVHLHNFGQAQARPLAAWLLFSLMLGATAVVWLGSKRRS